jgi:hypothetical protein
MLIVMRTLVVLAMWATPPSGPAATDNLRHVDFKNFDFPWSEPPGWSDHMEWLNVSEQNRVRLVNGRWELDGKEFEEGVKSQAPFAGLTLESVQFGDVTSDGREEAIVVLRFDTGGTQYSYYVFIYSSRAGRPSLLGYFHAGDRAYFGLYQVYPQGGGLVVELFDPQKRIGDCCSSGFVRTRYRWHKGKFEMFGPSEFGTPKAPSRIPVSIFGIHQ